MTFTIRDFVKTAEQKQYIYDGLLKANIGAGIIGALVSGASYMAKLEFWWLPGVATAIVNGFLTWSYLDDLSKAQITDKTTMAKQDVELALLGSEEPALF